MMVLAWWGGEWLSGHGNTAARGQPWNLQPNAVPDCSLIQRLYQRSVLSAGMQCAHRADVLVGEKNLTTKSDGYI